MTPGFNDRLDDCFGGPAAPAKPAAPVEHKITLTAEQTRAAEVGGFFETCRKCRGTGSFGHFGRCFACNGKGGKSFKTSAADRAKGREQAAARKVKTGEENWAGFAQAQPKVAAWIVERQDRFSFAMSMKEAVVKFGHLTERQLAACERLLAQDAARKVEDKARVANAPAIDVSKIEAAFDRARASAARPGQMGVWVRPLQLTSGDVTLSIREGSAGSEWQGMLFVKTRDGKKLGFVKQGKFTPRRECTDAEQAAVLNACSDPHAAAVAFGKAWSVCSVCNRGLTNDGSIERGIGPVCAEKFGW